jgi:hypothetical protein
MTSEALTPMPPAHLFMVAGIELRRYLVIKDLWPALSERERQLVVRRVIPRISLEDLLK